MSFWEWHESLARKLSFSKFGAVVFGKFLFLLALGMFFAEPIRAWSFGLAILGVIMTLPTFLGSITNWHYRQCEADYPLLMMSFIGYALLVLVLGSSLGNVFDPLKWIILLVGLVVSFANGYEVFFTPTKKVKAQGMQVRRRSVTKKKKKK